MICVMHCGTFLLIMTNNKINFTRLYHSTLKSFFCTHTMNIYSFNHSPTFVIKTIEWSMFMIKIYAFAILVLSATSSCNSNYSLNKEKSIQVKATYNTNLVPSGEKLSINIDSRTINRSICMIPYVAPDSSEYLFYLNGRGNDIYIFNLDSAKLIKTISLASDGPNGVGSMVRGFEVLNMDSLYITSAMIKKLFLVNSEGELLHKIDYSKYKQDYPILAGNTWTFGNARIGFQDGLIYLPFYTGYDENHYKNIVVDDIRTIAVLDTCNKIASTLNFSYPKDFWEDKFHPLFFGFFIYKNMFFINYRYDSRIMISKDSENWDAYEIKSKFIDVKQVVPPEKGMGGNYARLVADPFRDIFYRFVLHEQINFRDRVITDLARYPKKFSIIILDKDLNIIGETLFPEDKYDANGYFITKEGLYLSLSNPFNPDYNINKLEFQLFKLEQNEK